MQQAFDLLLDILRQNPINVTLAETMQGSQEIITAPVQSIILIIFLMATFHVPYSF